MSNSFDDFIRIRQQNHPLRLLVRNLALVLGEVVELLPPESQKLENSVRAKVLSRQLQDALDRIEELDKLDHQGEEK